MLSVICGEDISASRKYLSDLKDIYKKKGFAVNNIVPQQLEEIYKNSSGVISLFGEQQVYFVDKVSTFLSRKKTSFDDILAALVENKDIQIIDWEEKSAYELTALKKRASDLKEFKPEKSIFQLLDACYPTNLKGFLNSINAVHETQDETFIFTMISRHIRSLILAKENALDGKMSPWQKMNVQKQSKFWTIEKLIGFYEGLGRIDIALKTSGTPFNLKKSLDILACYFL